MYQSISQRFRRKNSNDLIVTFLPVVVVLTLHSYLRNADLNPTLFRVLQITAIVLLAALLAAVNHFYFRSFCYTLIDGSESRPREALRFPDDLLTFERVQNRKSRIYERVRRQEMLCLLEPGEAYDEKRFGPVSRTFLMTARSAKKRRPPVLQAGRHRLLRKIPSRRGADRSAPPLGRRKRNPQLKRRKLFTWQRKP